MSEHILVRTPAERVWLGRDNVAELEQCWKYMHAATNGSLPRKLLIFLSMNAGESSINAEDDSITIGMNQPAAAADLREFLLDQAARQMALMGLVKLSGGSILNPESEFLYEGMSEILTHEYNRSTRSLSGAWVVARYLDKTKQLGFSIQSDWITFSGGKRDFRSVAPGVTFLSLCRELYGRERALRLFEALGRGDLAESLASTFRSSPAALESKWIEKVRAFQDIADTAVNSEAEGPQLAKTVFNPPVARAGATLQIELFIKHDGRLKSNGVFVEDLTSGAVSSARAGGIKGNEYLYVNVPIEAARPAGTHKFTVTAVDESGNVRNWSGSYNVQ